nr:unnamed protein product [Digitaria exilis]
MKHYSIFTSSLCMRNMPEHKHDMLKNVMIIGFCSAKSMVELTCHILENWTPYMMKRMMTELEGALSAKQVDAAQ